MKVKICSCAAQPHNTHIKTIHESGEYISEIHLMTGRSLLISYENSWWLHLRIADLTYTAYELQRNLI